MMTEIKIHGQSNLKLVQIIVGLNAEADSGMSWRDLKIYALQTTSRHQPSHHSNVLYTFSTTSTMEI